MFEVLIREASARFDLGDKATPVLQMLLADMTRSETGALLGFLEPFKTAGLGPVVQSWLGGGQYAQALSNSQVEQVMGHSGGLLARMSERLEVERDKLTAAVAYLLPAVIGRLTPGGSLPASMPADVLSMAAAGQAMLDTPVAQASGGGFKWWPLALAAVVVALGLAYCSQKPASDSPAPAPAAQPAAPGTPPAAGEVASEAAVATPVATSIEGASAAASASAAAPASTPSAAASAGATASDSTPAAASVVAAQNPADGRPMLTVYFASGQSNVAAEFAERAADVLAFLKANPSTKAVISGFNDPSGNAQLNAELSKKRAQAVQAALEANGVAAEQMVLEKPADTTQSGSAAESRRVEVHLRD